jgi:hypothetical protein
MEWCSRNTVDLYSGDVPFESRLGDRTPDGFTVALRANASLRQEYFLPNPFQFINNHIITLQKATDNYAVCFMVVSYLVFLQTIRWRQNVHPQGWLTMNGLQRRYVPVFLFIVL